MVDEDGDGVCDNFVDEDGDGKCDHCRDAWKEARKGKGPWKRFMVDEDGDGVCDNFIDEDGDGKCDHCKEAMKDKFGHGRKFVDEDGDGVCDNFVDEDGDGKCDHCKGHVGRKRHGKGLFDVSQNYPNPFFGSTKINVNIVETKNVVIKLYDYTGNEVEEVYNGKLDAGDNSIDYLPAGLEPGLYFYQIIVDGETQTKQLMYHK